MTLPFDFGSAAPLDAWEDASSLVEQSVPAPALTALNELTPLLRVEQVRDRRSLAAFLEAYRTSLLVPLEWGAILQAHGHATRHQPRELIGLDAALAGEPLLRQFLEPSCRVGQRQLNRLRGLRDVRLVQRYRQAIEEGRARGWHTLVYGVWLAVFALPQRQGLLNYAERTLDGFIENAARPLRLSESDCRLLRTTACAPLAPSLTLLLGSSPHLRLVPPRGGASPDPL